MVLEKPEFSLSKHEKALHTLHMKATSGGRTGPPNEKPLSSSDLGPPQCDLLQRGLGAEGPCETDPFAAAFLDGFPGPTSNRKQE